MAAADLAILRCVGYSVTGDLGPYTFYTSRRRKLVFYARVPALNPPSRTQERIRNRWRQAAIDWQTLTATERADWTKAAHRCSLCATGYNLWVYWRTRKQRDQIRTIERQSGITLTL